MQGQGPGSFEGDKKRDESIPKVDRARLTSALATLQFSY
jgi:hypothetical protein